MNRMYILFSAADAATTAPDTEWADVAKLAVIAVMVCFLAWCVNRN